MIDIELLMEGYYMGLTQIAILKAKEKANAKKHGHQTQTTQP
jgi:hypothetical protein